ncbi:Glycogen synthase [Candidatus Zixiibacteriota bacterium]|nr:Glycogen synthase [candidate division Zixibacteria bacterium]
MKNLNIAFITPEAVPFAKTGGLADVSGILPRTLALMGHNVKLILPRYLRVKEGEKNAEISLTIPVGKDRYQAELYQLKDGKLPYEVIFIGNDHFFGRAELYLDLKTGKDYPDNAERFIFFSRAVLEYLRKSNWKADIIHCNDWQSALIPAYLKNVFAGDPLLKDAKSVFTIHNLAYQGQFPAEIFKKTGLDNALFDPTGPFEYWGKVNFLKSALYFADHITTVSPTYAKEIQTTSDYGMGLEGVLRDKAAKLTGILNGVDYSVWSPRNDKLIPYHYFMANLSGKKSNKLALLHQAGLPIRIDSPLFGMISRLDNQKGFDLIMAIMDEMMALDIQFILLGTGDREYHQFFEKMQKKYPDKFRPYLEFDNKLAHLIEAGADIFLMPSRYEPCGLNQMYSLKYGTVPLVRRTGGLADTVEDFDEKTQKGTGFVFEEYLPPALLTAVERAAAMFRKKRVWYKIVKAGMARDYSWLSSARKYGQLYEAVLNK